MSRYIIRRLLMMIPTLFIISVIVFAVIQLPPGDIVTSTLEDLQSQGQEANEETIASLRKAYNLDKPIQMQYLYWVGGLMQGDLGYSFMYQQPVNTLVGERIVLTMLIAFFSIIFTWVVAVPIGILSAVKQYSFSDYFTTVLAMLGMATPNFLLALVLMWFGFEYFGTSFGGLFSPEYINAEWSFMKVIDLLMHLWVPMIVLGIGGCAGMVRIMRANLLDELRKPYVTTAKAKGMRPLKMIIKYPVRIAILPFISGIGGILPALFSGSAIVSIVVDIPTTGPLLLNSLLNQDMYLAGSFIMILSVLSVIGVLISDLALAVLDPRIRYE
jgi:peptide/nickel transport system permease protein